MKKIVCVLVVAFFLFSCNNGGMDEEETGPFSLIGTWEAEGEFKDTDTFYAKSTLFFFDDTNYEQETIFNKQVTSPPPYKPKGTYTSTDDNIIYKEIFYKEDGSILTYNTYTIPYKFINKNTLETRALGIWENPNKINFKRKN